METSVAKSACCFTIFGDYVIFFPPLDDKAECNQVGIKIESGRDRGSMLTMTFLGGDVFMTEILLFVSNVFVFQLSKVFINLVFSCYLRDREGI